MAFIVLIILFIQFNCSNKTLEIYYELYLMQMEIKLPLKINYHLNWMKYIPDSRQISILRISILQIQKHPSRIEVVMLIIHGRLYKTENNKHLQHFIYILPIYQTLGVYSINTTNFIRKTILKHPDQATNNNHQIQQVKMI